MRRALALCVVAAAGCGQNQVSGAIDGCIGQNACADANRGADGDSGGNTTPDDDSRGGDDTPGDPQGSIDTGIDPMFPDGDITLTIDGATITVASREREVQTAAAIYDSGGTLVRTLWRKRMVAAGASIDATWDHDDDLGNAVADGAYEVKVIAHNVAYTWQGVVGNTSNPGASGLFSRTYSRAGSQITLATIGQNFHKSFHHHYTMAFDQAGNGFLTLGYGEGVMAIQRIASSSPQKRYPIGGRKDFQRIFDRIATDGNIVYVANTGLHGDAGSIFDRPENFIIGLDIASNYDEVDFAAGGPWTEGLGNENHWPNVIDVVADGEDAITDLAVEVNGNNLYVAHRSSGIRILDKTTGACKNCGGQLAVPNPRALALAANGDLWVVSNGTEVRKYTSPGGSPVLALTIPGFQKAIGLAVSPVTQTLVVIDAGADEQRLEAYDTTTGSLKWTHGVRGGYTTASGTAITANKFNFADRDIDFVAFEPVQNGVEVFWVGDPGNQRSLKLEIPTAPAAENPLLYRDEIMYLPGSYKATVDKGNPTRVFSSFLEFSVDYSKPIQESWKLARNWDTKLPAYLKLDVEGLKSVYTTPSGRTYALISVHDYVFDNAVVELRDSGIRDTGIIFPYGSNFQEGMNVRYSKRTGDALQIIERAFTGIDGDGNPIFGNEALVASVPLRNAANRPSPVHGPCANGANEPVFPKTSTGILITFDPCAHANPDVDYDGAGLHLGGVKVGASDFTFRASPGGAFTIDSASNMVADGDGIFNIQDLPQDYAGGPVLTAGRNVVYNYFGEFWHNSQANQWMHFLDNGLFVGQFGTSGVDFAGGDAIAGQGGNTFSATMITVDGNVYVYHNDEHAHGGVHRWRIANLQSMQEMTGAIGKNVTVTNAPTIVSHAFQH